MGLNYAIGGFAGGVAWEHHEDYITAAARSGVANGGNTGMTAGNGFVLGSVVQGGVGQVISNIPVGTGTAFGISSDKDDAYNINLRYTFQNLGPGALTIGGYWEELKYKLNYSGTGPANSTNNLATNVNDFKRDAWRFEAVYQMGPHTFGAQYGNATSVKGTLGANSGGSFSNEADDSGAYYWLAAYAYSLSKRTSLYAYYTKVTNQTNARYNGIVFGGIGPNAGGDPMYTGVGIKHAF